MVDYLLAFDIILYFLSINVIANAMFKWLPSIFNSLLDLFGRYLNRHVLIVICISFIILLCAAIIRMQTNGAYVYKLHSVAHALVRSLMLFTGGWFLEPGVKTFGIEENLNSLSDYLNSFNMIATNAGMFFIFQFLFFNIFVALTLVYLKESRTLTEERDRVLLMQADEIIER